MIKVQIEIDLLIIIFPNKLRHTYMFKVYISCTLSIPYGRFFGIGFISPEQLVSIDFSLSNSNINNINMKRNFAQNLFWKRPSRAVSFSCKYRSFSYPELIGKGRSAVCRCSVQAQRFSAAKNRDPGRGWHHIHRPNFNTRIAEVGVVISALQIFLGLAGHFSK